MTPREYVTNQPVGSIIQLWAMKKNVKEKTDSSLLSSLFALSESGILSVHWLVLDLMRDVEQLLELLQEFDDSRTEN